MKEEIWVTYPRWCSFRNRWFSSPNTIRPLCWLCLHPFSFSFLSPDTSTFHFYVKPATVLPTTTRKIARFAQLSSFFKARYSLTGASRCYRWFSFFFSFTFTRPRTRTFKRRTDCLQWSVLSRRWIEEHLLKGRRLSFQVLCRTW